MPFYLKQQNIRLKVCPENPGTKQKVLHTFAIISALNNNGLNLFTRHAGIT